MKVSSRTPEGEPNRCPICDSILRLEPSEPFGDAPCPFCGHLIWFIKRQNGIIFYDLETAKTKKLQIRQFIANQLGVSVNKVPESIQGFNSMDLAADSLDVVELFMEFEAKFDTDPE